MTTTSTTDHVDLQLTGMTCAACAARIEKKLNRLDGVHATVNYATERASITFDPEVVTTDRHARSGRVDRVQRRGARCGRT